MNDRKPDDAFDQKLRAALGAAGTPDFEAWTQRHADAVACLNPAVIERQRRKRKLLMRTAKAMLAAAACAAVIWSILPQKVSFAQAIKRLEGAKSITWTHTVYRRSTSADGKRTWISQTRSAFAYLNGVWRLTEYDDAGNARYVHIVDGTSGRKLNLDLKDKTADDWRTGLWVKNGPRGPFGWVADALEQKPLEFVGRNQVRGKTVNVFLFHREYASGDRTRDEVWINPQSKEVVGVSETSGDVFDPDNLPDKGNRPEKKFSNEVGLGVIDDDFDYDAKIDPDDFRFEPPPGYTLVPNPVKSVTEADLVEWFGAIARVNDDTFPSHWMPDGGLDMRLFSKIRDKKKAERTQPEQKIVDLYERYLARGETESPVNRFLREHAAPGSFCYVGVGVKLETPDRLVCWYKPKSGGKLRAIYADLTARGVTPPDLPLPVSPSTGKPDLKVVGAKSITWTSTAYTRCTSKDGKRTWLQPHRRSMAYRFPDLFRMTEFDDAGKPSYVEITDGATGKHLCLDLKHNRILWRQRTSVPMGHHPEGPFGNLPQTFEREPLEFVGQRQVNGRTANVFRIHFQKRQWQRTRSQDYWFDAKTKQLVGNADIGADQFDPETDPDRGHPAEKKRSHGKMLGTIMSDFVVDAKLDPDLFNLTPPAGFELVPKPSIAIGEPELVEWLGAVARVNNDTFPAGLESHVGFEPTRWSEISRKKPRDRSAAERTMNDLDLKYFRAGEQGTPVQAFTQNNAAPGSFRYVGVGVKLGDAKRIVCWYQSKGTGKYRAIYGDLKIKDVTSNELPLPVSH
jgi:outer membrane lipoprotein-sorting protein